MPENHAEFWNEVEEVFAAALEADAAARPALLDARCDGRAELRAEVDALLAAAARAGSFITPQTLPHSDLVPDQSRPALAAGSRVGPFRLIARIGQGGMGEVYRAERVEADFTQQVAIKLIAARFHGADALRRFRAERQILAALQHPNIVALLDGGVTPDGQPYTAMEYVDGAPIAEFCRAQALPLEARLRLFQQVCAAVSFAHRHLVVHRDLKPANVLVTGEGVVKVLDFGIAKLLEPGVAAASGTTMLMAPFTPDYASPEQVRGLPVTTACDVYALGVMLYELLTGRRPYETAGRPLDEVVALVVNREPGRPSAAAGGGVPYDGRRLRGDLDAIVLKAMAKDPARRYASASDLTDDVARFLAGKPVEARPPSMVYIARKTLVRHRAAFTIAAVGLVLLMAALVGAVWQAGVAARERARAVQRFDDVRTMANALVFELHDAIADLPGSLSARQQLVNHAAEYLDRLAREADGEWALQRELAAANVRLGDIIGGGGISNLGDIAGAEARYRIALEILESLVAREAGEPTDVEGLARLRIQLSRLLIAKGDLAGAERNALEAIELLSTDANGEIDLARAHHQLGYALARRGNDSAALESLAEATHRARRLLENEPDDANAVARLVRIAGDYGYQLQRAGNTAESHAVLRDARARLEGLIERDPLNARHRFTLVHLLNIEAAAYRTERNFQSASELSAAAVQTSEKLRSDSPTDQEVLLGTMISRYWHGLALISSGDPASGIRSLRRAVVEGEAIVRDSPANAAAANQLAGARVDLGAALLEIDVDSREGCDALGRGLEGWRELEARGQLPGDSAENRAQFERRWPQCAK